MGWDFTFPLQISSVRPNLDLVSSHLQEIPFVLVCFNPKFYITAINSRIAPKTCHETTGRLTVQSAFCSSAGNYSQQHLKCFKLFGILRVPGTLMDPTDGVQRPSTTRLHFPAYSFRGVPKEHMNLQLKSSLVCPLFQVAPSALLQLIR